MVIYIRKYIKCYNHSAYDGIATSDNTVFDASVFKLD